ncbi:hypothetical protein BKA70DRAFT_1307155 [Coprinopsis sp. MPI-PUGE-AT-0042]|nr:hypothetical protein BKA70DRAFT_1310388 [Coprinopsis sp. MPI-PUGE-AT-0042]KAH6902069.1 hypothetical protein BKA70DRAFT_1307155 [Coprinopsis sp. MPI-PUGE-AT-0042]
MSDSGTLLAGDIPPEIWSIVFRIVLGSNAFGPDERRAYTRLRSVCAAWRTTVATTPDLCSGLFIDRENSPSSFDKEAFKTKYDPWLTIVSLNHPYHLVVGAGWDVLDEDDSASLAHYLLCEAGPKPTTVHVHSCTVFDGMLSITDICNNVIHLNVESKFQDLDRYNISQLAVVFPQLESFATKACIMFDNLLSHPNLRSLTILDALGSSEDLARLCMGLPCLRELKISTDDVLEDIPPIAALESPFTHSALEILHLEGEDIVPLVAHLTLPSLKFLGIKAWGMFEAGSVLEDTLPAFFQRSSIFNIPVALKGRCLRPFFAALTRSLPPATTLLLDFYFMAEEGPERNEISSDTFLLSNIKEIVYFNLQWLHECGTLPSHSQLTKIYAPEKASRKEEVQQIEKHLSDKGYALEKCSPRVMDGILSLSVPHMTIEWELRNEL